MASPVAPCSGVHAPVAERRIKAQGRELDHLVRDGDITRSRGCSQYVPIDQGLLDGALEDSTIAESGGMQSATGAYALLKAHKHTIRIGAASKDNLFPSLLGHYAFCCTAEGEPQVGLVTKVAASCGAFVAHVQISSLPWSTNTPVFPVLATVLRRDWNVSAIYNAEARAAAWSEHAMHTVTRHACNRCKEAQRDATRWLDRRMARHKDPVALRRLTAGKNNHAPISCMTPTTKKKRSSNHRKAFSRRLAQKNAAHVNLRCVRNIDDQQSHETALEGEAIILSQHSKILREVLDDYPDDGMSKVPFRVPGTSQ